MDRSLNDPDLVEWISARSDPFGARHGLARSGCAGLFLGCVFGVHLTLLVQLAVGALPMQMCLLRWCCYIVALSGFHAAEFLTTARYKWKDVSYDSWLLNHSAAYGYAAAAAMVEFWLEAYFPPDSNRQSRSSRWASPSCSWATARASRPWSRAASTLRIAS